VKVRSDAGLSLLAARLAHETRFQIREPDLIRPWICADRDHTNALSSRHEAAFPEPDPVCTIRLEQAVRGTSAGAAAALSDEPGADVRLAVAAVCPIRLAPWALSATGLLPELTPEEAVEWIREGIKAGKLTVAAIAIKQ
jgi:hypothetical protein